MASSTSCSYISFTSFHESFFYMLDFFFTYYQFFFAALVHKFNGEFSTLLRAILRFRYKLIWCYLYGVENLSCCGLLILSLLICCIKLFKHVILIPAMQCYKVCHARRTFVLWRWMQGRNGNDDAHERDFRFSTEEKKSYSWIHHHFFWPFFQILKYTFTSVQKVYVTF